MKAAFDKQLAMDPGANAHLTVMQVMTKPAQRDRISKLSQKKSQLFY